MGIIDLLPIFMVTGTFISLIVHLMFEFYMAKTA